MLSLEFQLSPCDLPQRLSSSFRNPSVASLCVSLLISPKLTRVTCNQICVPGGQALS